MLNATIQSKNCVTDIQEWHIIGIIAIKQEPQGEEEIEKQRDTSALNYIKIVSQSQHTDNRWNMFRDENNPASVYPRIPH